MSWPRRTAPAVESGREGSAPTPQPARRRVACALARVVRLVWCRRRPTRRRPRATAPFTRLPPDPTPPPARLPTPPTRLALPAARPASAPTAPAGCAGPPIDPPRTAGRVRTSPTPAAHARARWTLVQRRRCGLCQTDRRARRGGFPCRRSSTGETPVADNVRHGLEVCCLHHCEKGLCWLIVQEGCCTVSTNPMQPQSKSGHVGHCRLPHLIFADLRRRRHVGSSLRREHRAQVDFKHCHCSPPQ